MMKQRRAREGGAGLVLFGADAAIVASDAAGRRWLGQHSTRRAIADAARRALDGDGRHDAHVRTASGVWLVLRAFALDGARAAVTIEPDLPPLIADAFELTEQERAITQLVAEGLATRGIADQLHVSPWTVQDHLKSIFAKVGVGTRGALVARVFFGQEAPRLSPSAGS